MDYKIKYLKYKKKYIEQKKLSLQYGRGLSCLPKSLPKCLPNSLLVESQEKLTIDKILNKIFVRIKQNQLETNTSTMFNLFDWIENIYQSDGGFYKWIKNIVQTDIKDIVQTYAVQTYADQTCAQKGGVSIDSRIDYRRNNSGDSIDSRIDYRRNNSGYRLGDTMFYINSLFEIIKDITCGPCTHKDGCNPDYNEWCQCSCCIGYPLALALSLVIISILILLIIIITLLNIFKYSLKQCGFCIISQTPEPTTLRGTANAPEPTTLRGTANAPRQQVMNSPEQPLVRQYLYSMSENWLESSSMDNLGIIAFITVDDKNNGIIITTQGIKMANEQTEFIFLTELKNKLEELEKIKSSESSDTQSLPNQVPKSSDTQSLPNQVPKSSDTQSEIEYYKKYIYLIEFVQLLNNILYNIVTNPSHNSIFTEFTNSILAKVLNVINKQENEDKKTSFTDGDTTLTVISDTNEEKQYTKFTVKYDQEQYKTYYVYNYCPICMDYKNEPMIINKCNHAICTECYGKCREVKGNHTKCPICSDSMGDEIRGMQLLIDNFKPREDLIKNFGNIINLNLVELIHKQPPQLLE